MKKPTGKLAKILSKNSNSKPTHEANIKTIQNSIFKRKKPVNVSITVPRKNKNKIEFKDEVSSQRNAGNLTDRNPEQKNKTPKQLKPAADDREEEPKILSANKHASARNEVLNTEEPFNDHQLEKKEQHESKSELRPQTPPDYELKPKKHKKKDQRPGNENSKKRKMKKVENYIIR